MKDLYWICPKCKSKVNYSAQMRDVFTKETDMGLEAEFDPESGLYMHIITCTGCGSRWNNMIGGRFHRRTEMNRGDN